MSLSTTPKSSLLHTVAAAAVLMLLLASSPSWAKHEKGGIEVPVGVGYLSSSDDLDLTVYGLRAHVRFNPRWAMEGSLTVQDGLDSDDDPLFFDLSARVTAYEWKSAEMFALFGAGFVDFDTRIFNTRISSTSATFHAGLGIQVDLNERLYLRPDLRYRWGSDLDSIDDGITELTAALGWRF
ncbi:MAG: porin family protein [Acidobacteriota bacterium]